MLVILFLNAILIPYNIAFLSNESNSLENQDSFRWFFAFSDVWFILDILLTFRTGKKNKLKFFNQTSLHALSKFLGIMNDMSDQSVIFEPNEIRGLYVRGWFFVDLISSVPWDEILHLFMNNANLNITYLKLLRIVKILKLLRLTRMAKVMRHWEDVLDFQV